MVSLGLLFLRAVIGLIMVTHGYPKLFGGEQKSQQLPDEAKQTLGEGFVESVEQGGIENTAGLMEKVGVPNPKGAAWAIALVEFVGGLMLLLGWKTRLAATAIAYSQVVAINKVHAEQGFFGGYEYNAALIGGAGALALTGPGKLSLDG